ncbi:MAG: hypothetical protein AMJ56_03610 [Anaerolineae bacterium SG8_19]|nr:MAG: hypothetical protein AMJ56_03610 [Anaerolineae bacterium SG8_19]
MASHLGGTSYAYTLDNANADEPRQLLANLFRPLFLSLKKQSLCRLFARGGLVFRGFTIVWKTDVFLTPFECKSTCINMANFVKKYQRSVGQC